jgi:ABC-type dipeptide/oligopeptide/nickel transport system permease subunit
MTMPTGLHSPHDSGSHGGHRGHGLMMIACCIPMLLIALALVATGVASFTILFVAVACTAMMAMMMRGMHGNPPPK